MMLTPKLLQKAHFDLWEPNNPAFIENNCYFIIIIDNNTRKIQTYNIISKDIFFSIFKIWKKSMEIAYKQIVEANILALH